VTLGEIMAETEQEKTDIFYVQQQMLDTLTDLFVRQDQQRPQPVYVSPAAPIPKPPNYLLYIGIVLGFLLLSGRFKL